MQECWWPDREQRLHHTRALNTGNRELVSRGDILSSIMFLSAALLVGAVLLIVIFSLNQRSKNLPPGPRPLPIFGNLLDLNLSDPVPEMERVRCIGNGCCHCCPCYHCYYFREYYNNFPNVGKKKANKFYICLHVNSALGHSSRTWIITVLKLMYELRTEQADWTPQIDFVWGRGVSSGMITFSCWLCAVTNKQYWSLLSKSAHWCVAKSRFWKSVKLCWDKWKDVRRAINTAILLCNKTKQLYYNYMSCWTLFRVKNLHFYCAFIEFLWWTRHLLWVPGLAMLKTLQHDQ